MPTKEHFMTTSVQRVLRCDGVVMQDSCSLIDAEHPEGGGGGGGGGSHTKERKDAPVNFWVFRGKMPAFLAGMVSLRVVREGI